MAPPSGPREARKLVSGWLTRFIAGDCTPHEVLPVAREAGFPSFADLCLAALPERLPRVAFTRAAIRARLGDALVGRTPLADLRVWAEELHAIAFQHVLGRDRGERRLAASALALVAVASDERVFRSREPVLAVLAGLEAALAKREPLPLASLHSRLFAGQRELDLATRRPSLPPLPGHEASEGQLGQRLLGDGALGDAGPGEPLDATWADVVARAGPGRYSPADPCPAVAFSVVTATTAGEDALDRRSAATGLLALVRERAPNFALGRYRPRIQHDPDGAPEIVLRTAVVDEAALAYATKLFALVHGLGAVTLDGERLATLRPC